MQTLQEVLGMLTELEQKEGKEAAYVWVLEHAKELPEEIQEEVIFRYTTDAFIEEFGEEAELTGFVEQGVEALANMQADRKAIEDELKTLDVKERLEKNK